VRQFCAVVRVEFCKGHPAAASAKMARLYGPLKRLAGSLSRLEPNGF